MPTNHNLPMILNKLRLSTMSQQWQTLEAQAQEQHWSYSEYLTALGEQEVAMRETRRIARHKKEAGLPPGKYFSTLQREALQGLNTQQLEPFELQTHWVDEAHNLLLFGPSGVGKTHLAAAIGYQLIEKGKRIKFLTALTLVQQLQVAKRELKLQETLFKWDKYDLIILDDLGYVKKNDAETSVLFEFIAHRYESRSLLITANQPFSEWESIFGDTMMTVAAIDRLVHHAQIVELAGDSYRKKAAMKLHPPPDKR